MLPTSLVGSYPQPGWLIDREALRKSGVPRTRVPEVWRIPSEHLAQAQDDATVVAIREQERLGLDIVTDGEIRRESYSNRFATALAGVDPAETGTVAGRTDSVVQVPVFSGKVARRGPTLARDVAFLRAHTDRPIKATVPGPFTMSEQAETTFYEDREALAMDLAEAVHEEIEDLFAAGADVVQLDEPWTERRLERSKRYGAEAIGRAIAGIEGTVAVHVCFGYGKLVTDKPAAYQFLEDLAGTAVAQVSIETAQPRLDLSQLDVLASKTVILGVLDLADERVESPAVVARRIEAALEHVDPERLVVAPDCGMKYLSRQVAFAKLQSMVEGAAIVRESLSSP